MKPADQDRTDRDQPRPSGGGGLAASFRMTPPPDEPPPPDPPPGPVAIVFAAAFGVVLPVVCLVFDPMVFRSSGALFGGALFGAYKVVGYSAVGLGVASMTVWLVRRRPAGLLSGLLAGGAAFALCMGVVLLPFSLIGLVIVIGVLGFVPFGTAWVCVRQARAAWQATGGGGTAKRWAVVGFLVACAGPWGLQVGGRAATDSATAAALSENPAEAERGLAALERLRFVVDADGLVWAYSREEDPGRRERLAAAYQRVTGGDVEHRLAVLND